MMTYCRRNLRNGTEGQGPCPAYWLDMGQGDRDFVPHTGLTESPVWIRMLVGAEVVFFGCPDEKRAAGCVRPPYFA